MSLLRDARLRAFHTVALHKSFTRAAQHLLLTQQAVSFQVKSLEEEFGAKLFFRRGRTVELTRAGRVLFDYADKILELYVEAENHLAELTGFVPNRLRIAATSSVARYVLPRAIGQFRTRYPTVQITLEVGNSQFVIDCLRDGLVDAAITSEGPTALSAYRTEAFLEDEVTFIGSADHPWGGGTGITLTDFLDAPFILRGEGSATRQLLERRLLELDFTLDSLNVVLVLGSAEAVKGAVEAGAGIGMVSGLAARDAVIEGKLRKIKINDLLIKRNFYVVHPPNRRIHKLANEFIDLARSEQPL